MIKETELYQADPFQFRLFPGSLACHRKGLSAPVLMVEVERDQVLMGLDYFCRSLDGENPLSPCGIPYPFFTLYQNQLANDDRFRIIQDIQLHINDVDIVHLYSFTDIELMVTLRQNKTIKLRKLLMALCANKTSNRLFLQVEKELDPEAIICVYNKTDKDMVMANLPFLSTYIKQCVIEEDFGKIFGYNDHSIIFPTKSVPVKVGKLQVNTRPILQDVQDHTTRWSVQERREFPLLPSRVLPVQLIHLPLLRFVAASLLTLPLPPSYYSHVLTSTNSIDCH